MAAIARTPVDEVYDLLRESQWAEALEASGRALSANLGDAPQLQLAHAIALIRSGSTQRGLKLLTSECLAAPNSRIHLRRFVVPWLIQQGALDPAAQVLSVLIQSGHTSIEDLRLCASILGRLKRWNEAIGVASRLIELSPADLPGHTAYLQLLLQSGRTDEAGSHALSLGDDIIEHPKLGAMALLSLTRSGQIDAAAQIARMFDETRITDSQLAGSIVRALFEAGKAEEAVEAGERLLASGCDQLALRSFLGQAYMATHVGDRYERAIEHFQAGLALDPDDPRMNSSIGEALLRSRDYEQAIPHLERACRLQPKVPQARALYARALKQAGRYEDAAREFRRLLEMQPSAARWQRYAAGALSQAGNKREAAALFDSFVARRRKALPKDFESGLDALWNKVDTVEIPKARLDWAWTLSNTGANDRTEWERRARWGHLADHYLLDWLECRDDRIHEAMLQLADLSEAESVLSEIDSNKGVILASAHIGPMYAGPLALELLGLRSRWLASTPSVARTAYAGSLISTSDQDDMHVARSFTQSLRDGFAVVLAVDGAINLAAPRVPFEGQEMTYSSFAARTAHRLEVPSLFCAPKWENGKIGFVLERLPDPLPKEDADAHAERWRKAFFQALRDYLGGAPENLRLSGGLWRHIR